MKTNAGLIVITTFILIYLFGLVTGLLIGKC